MYRERVDLKFHDEDDTVSYLVKNTYVFNKDKSGCRSESDVVTVVHAPILVSHQWSPLSERSYCDDQPYNFSRLK